MCKICFASTPLKTMLKTSRSRGAWAFSLPFKENFTLSLSTIIHEKHLKKYKGQISGFALNMTAFKRKALISTCFFKCFMQMWRQWCSKLTVKLTLIIVLWTCKKQSQHRMHDARWNWKNRYKFSGNNLSTWFMTPDEVLQTETISLLKASRICSDMISYQVVQTLMATTIDFTYSRESYLTCMLRY